MISSSAHWVRLHPEQVELPAQKIVYPLPEPSRKLREQLASWSEHLYCEAWRSIFPKEQREAARVFRNLGESLFTWINGTAWRQHLRSNVFLLLQIEDPAWADYPWELLHDGRMWLGLHQGVIRLPPANAASSQYSSIPQVASVTAPNFSVEQPLRMVTTSAQPPAQGDNQALIARLRRMQKQLPPDFLNLPESWRSFPQQSTNDHPPVDYRTLDPLGRSNLLQLLAASPNVFWLSSYADEHGWYLESPQARLETVNSASLKHQLEIANRNGLKLLLLQDSSSWIYPAHSHKTDIELLGSGVPHLVRVRGMLSPTVQSRYLKQLLAGLTAGYCPASSHLNAIQHVALWGGHHGQWAHLRLLQSLLFSSPITKTATVQNNHQLNWQQFWRQHQQHPLPTISKRSSQRCADRHLVLLGLLQYLDPQSQSSAPLVHLKAPASSGKTILVQEAVHHLASQYAQVLYVDGKHLPSSLEESGLQSVIGHQDTNNNEVVLWQSLKSMLEAKNCKSEKKPGSQQTQLDDETPMKISKDFRAAWLEAPPTLLVMEHVEHREEWRSVADVLARNGGSHRALVLTRTDEETLNSKAVIELNPLDEEGFGYVFGPFFLQALATRSDAEQLRALCAEHLLLGRLLSSALDWPPSKMVKLFCERATDPTTGETNKLEASKEILYWLVQSALPHFSMLERKLLILFSLCPAPLHVELLKRSVQERECQTTLEQLEKRGWLQSLNNRQMWSLSGTLRHPLSEQLLNQTSLEQACTSLLEAMLSLLREQSPHTDTQSLQPLQTLLVEQQANICELALLLLELKQAPALLSLYQQLKPCFMASSTSVSLVHCEQVLLACLLRSIEQCRQRRQSLSAELAAMELSALVRMAQQVSAIHNRQAAIYLAQKALKHPAAQNTASKSNLNTNTTSHQLLYAHQILSESLLVLHSFSKAKTAIQHWLQAAKDLQHPQSLIQACQQLFQLHQHTAKNNTIPSKLLSTLQTQLDWLKQHQVPSDQIAQLEALLARCLWQINEQQAFDLAKTAIQNWPSSSPSPSWISLLLAQAYLQKNQPNAAWKAFSKSHCNLHMKEATAILQKICWQLQQCPDTSPQQLLKSHLLLEEHLRSQQAPEQDIAQVLDKIGGFYYRLGEHQKSTQAYQRRLQLQPIK